MRKIYFLFFFFGVLVTESCRPDKYDVLNLASDPNQVKFIRIKANSHVLYADNISELSLQFDAFDIISNTRRKKITLPDGSSSYKDSVYIDTIKMQQSRVENAVQFFKENGTQIPSTGFKTSAAGDFKVYAKIGTVQSQLLTINVRTPMAVQPKVIVPVIFHVLSSPGETTPVVTSEFLQTKLDELNVLFNRTKVFASNGGNANVEFKLALYDPNKRLLVEKGINRKDVTRKGIAMKPDIVANTWNPKRYLNVWICTYQPYGSQDPPVNMRPVTKLNAATALPGLTFAHNIGPNDAVNTSNPEFTGIVIGANFQAFNRVYSWQLFSFDWFTSFGEYYGLLATNAPGGDFCTDTYDYTNAAVGLGNYEKISIDGYRFNSENVMDVTSPKKMISAEQAERIRWVLDNCPSRWAWKSKFALTGVD